MIQNLQNRIAKPLPGSRRQDLDTPSLIVDLDALERNVSRMSDFCRQNRIAWRPHAKSYKCVEVAQMVVAAGAIGVTCAKLGEAEVFAEAGIADLLITCPIVGPQKVARLVQLCRQAKPIAVVDDLAQARAISTAAASANVTVRLLIEIDLGMNRCGIAPGEPALILAKQIAALPHIELAGIMGWEGHLLTIADPAEKRSKISAAIQLLADTKQCLVNAGLPCPIISAGGTGSFQITGTLGIADELQAGGVVFMDLFYKNLCQVSGMEHALFVLGTVTSRPTPARAVLDFGRKTTSPDLHLPQVYGRNDVAVKWLSAEHAVLEVTSQPGPSVGDRLELIPGYGDWTTVLHDRLYVFRGDQLVDVWELAARGRAD